jgi:transcriptional regulator with XRE-family HTH domain
VGRTAGEVEPAPPIPTPDSARSRVLLEVGYRVGSLRFDQQMTWAQLAYRAGGGVRAPQIQNLESGTRDVQLTTLVRIASALGIRSLDSLLGPMPIELYQSR